MLCSGQCELKLQATLRSVAYRDIATVEEYRVLNNRETKARTSEFARTTLVNAVETLEDMSNMLLVDADTVVRESYCVLFVALSNKTNEYVATTRVGDGVVC